MVNFRDKISRFMYGRYGADQLYYALIVLYIILMAVNIFVHAYILSILMWAVFVIIIFRVLSRNIYKRRIENDRFMKVWNPVKSQFTLVFRSVKECKTHRFRKCPKCKKILRLPNRKGKLLVNCPCCNNEFEVRIKW